MYEQSERDYTAFGMTQVATYQVLDIQISGDRLVYRAFDIDGNRRDEFVIEKAPRAVGARQGGARMSGRNRPRGGPGVGRGRSGTGRGRSE